uniref:Uncharacterized protein n=1 Tax=Panagrolaimus sp. JU765 TaxID=591449 RepID=A0AC34QFB3_9BILA
MSKTRHGSVSVKNKSGDIFLKQVVTAEQVRNWMQSGDVGQLENLLLQGKSHLIEGTEVVHPKTAAFLKTLPIYKHKMEAFLEALYLGDETAVASLVDYKKLILTRHPFTSCSTIHLAVIHNYPTILKLLLGRPNAPINSKDMEGRTPLHYAAAMCGVPGSDNLCYDILVDNGANEYQVDLEGYTPSNYRQMPRLIDMTQIQGLNRYPMDGGDHIDKMIFDRNIHALQNMVVNGEFDRIEKRIFPPHARDMARILTNLHMRIKAIHQAVVDDDLPTLKQLVDSYDMATCRDPEGRTPLHIGVLFNREGICRYLLLLYPNCIDLTDREGRTALHYASALTSSTAKKTMTTILIRAGATEIPNGQPRIRGSSRKKLYANLNVDPSGNEMFQVFSDEDEEIDREIEARIFSIDFDKKEYRDLEELQFEGKGEQIWAVVKKHLGNDRLVKYIHGYRQIQAKLHEANQLIEENDIEKLKAILDSELVQARDSRGLTVLHHAVLKEKHEAVEYIAHAFPKYLNIVDQAGRAPVHYAAIQKNAIYDTLVDAGADNGFADKDGYTAQRYRNNPSHDLTPVSTAGNASASPIFMRRLSLDDSMFDQDAPPPEKVERWLATGDVQNLENLVLDGRSHLLLDKDSVNLATSEFLDGLTQYQAKIDAIHKAVEEGDVRRVKSLIDRIQLSTARDRHGMTPLHKALLYGQTNTVRYLLAKYPHCVNCTDHAGRTALHYAAADPNGEHMIKVLQKSGGDAFIEDKYGHTPFYYRTHGKRLNMRTLKDNAVINQLISGQLNRPLLQDLEEDISDWIHTGNVGKLEELVLNGYADLLLGRNHQVDDSDAVGFLEVLPQYQAKIQAIHRAIEQGNLRAVKLLTDRKKLALCRDGKGLAPLHKAVVFGRTDIAKYLIRNYPQSVNAMDQNKRTPLHYAAAYKDGGYLYKLMRKAGADPNIFDCNGRPPKYYLKYPGEINLEQMQMDTKQALKQVLHNRVAPSYLETNIQQWLREGNLGKLDQLVLSGCGDLLLDKKSANSDTQAFLKELPSLLETIDGIHRSIREGNAAKVKQLITTKRLALARDKHGCTPLHTAIVYEETEIVRFIAAHFPMVLNAPDYNKRTPMHYAAATKDGGHYMKILGKAGADAMAVDNEGRTPDYYRRNPIFDLKMMKENNNDLETFQQSILDDAPAIDTPPSPESASLCSSLVDSGRHEDDDEIDSNRFEKLIQDKLDLPTSENGLYLARTVAPVLTKALAEMLLRRPANPIGFISEWLVRYNDEDESTLDV